MNEIKLININNDLCLDEGEKHCSPHPNIMESLFGEKRLINRYFSDIKGICCVDHFAVKVFDYQGRFLIFSSTPSVEYNLITSNLWRHDKNFYPIEEHNQIKVWDEHYNSGYSELLHKIKSQDHHFKFGFDMGCVKNDMKVTYTFATRSIIQNYRDYYEKNMSELLIMSAYAHRNILATIEKLMNRKVNPQLRLIVNNQRGDYES